MILVDYWGNPIVMEKTDKKDLSKNCAACMVTWMACLKCINPNCSKAQGKND